MVVEMLKRLAIGSSCGLLLLGLAAGCERKEKVLDIETPRGEIEIERSTDTGKVDIEVNGK